MEGLGPGPARGMSDLLVGDALPIRSWETPASQIPDQRLGWWRVTKEVVKAGTTLPMHGVFGYDEAYFLEDATITALKEGRRVWASDSPYEYYGMWELAARAKGPRVLVGGLGLLANIIALRRDVEEVTVVELSREVVRMVGPYVPTWVEIVEGDFFEVAKELARSGRRYDTIIVDVFASSSERDEKLCRTADRLLKELYPQAVRLFWAFQRERDTEEVLRSMQGVRLE